MLHAILHERINVMTIIQEAINRVKRCEDPADIIMPKFGSKRYTIDTLTHVRPHTIASESKRNSKIHLIIVSM